MPRHFLICLCFFGMCSTSSFAQVLQPVKWVFSLEQVSETEYKLHADATIDKGWVIYSQDLGSDGPIPTSINITASEGLTLAGPATEHGELIEKNDPIFQMVLKKYEDKLRLTQNIIVDADTRKVSGYLEFMCCDAEKCLPPEIIDFDLSL